MDKKEIIEILNSTAQELLSGKIAIQKYQLLLASKGCTCKTCQFNGFCNLTYEKEKTPIVCENWVKVRK